MNLNKAISSLNFKQLSTLFWLCISYPLYVIPSYTATRKTVAICNKEFGKKHHKNGKANAFRHALWNALIIIKNIHWGRSPLRAAAWAKKVTDWHEDFSPNVPLAKAMDLHNNRIGRDYAQHHPKVSTSQMTKLIMVLIPLSRKLNTIHELDHFLDHLVYIEDD